MDAAIIGKAIRQERESWARLLDGAKDEVEARFARGALAGIDGFESRLMLLLQTAPVWRKVGARSARKVGVGE